MRIIKNIDEFLNEAKIKDLLLKPQADEVASYWGEKFLDYEEVEPTSNIEQGKWKLSEEDRNLVLGYFLGSSSTPTDMNEVFSLFDSISDHLSDLLLSSIDHKLIKEKVYSGNYKKFESVIKDFNPKKPSIDQIKLIHDLSIFKKLSVNETKKDELIKKDENGRPELDDEGNIIKIKKEIGEPVFEKNLTNINGFIESYNRSYNTNYDFNIRNIRNILSILNDMTNDSYEIDFNIFNRDIYLLIRHKPHDILNMSISKFYSSCQHLYSGSYRSQLLANVFDPNSIPAFLIFDTPIYSNGNKISEFLPLSRMMIRNLESFDNKNDLLFFDRSYPDRMKHIFDKLVPKYTSNKMLHNEEDYYNKEYIFTPDIDLDDSLSSPYMDKLGLKRKILIGKNIKKLHLNRTYNWSTIKISPNASIDQLIIETDKLPDNLLILKLPIKWIKFSFLTIKELLDFKNIINENLYFNKCKIENKIFEDISSLSLKKINITSCELNYKAIKNLKLETLELIYTIEDINELEYIIQNNEIKNLKISDDIINNKESKEKLKEIKSNYPNTKIQLTGLSI